MLLEASYRIHGEMLLNRTFFSLQSITFRKILTQVVSYEKNCQIHFYVKLWILISVLQNPNIRNIIVCVGILNFLFKSLNPMYHLKHFFLFYK